MGIEIPGLYIYEWTVVDGKVKAGRLQKTLVRSRLWGSTCDKPATQIPKHHMVSTLGHVLVFHDGD